MAEVEFKVLEEMKNSKNLDDLVAQYKDDANGFFLLAKAAEISENYMPMVRFTKEFIATKKREVGEDFHLDVQERNLLSVAYKNVVGQRRASLRTIKTADEEIDPDCLAGYRKILETELEEKCRDVLDLIQKNLLPSDQDIQKMQVPADKAEEQLSEEDKARLDYDVRETTVFYLKMCGDYYRYLAEFKVDDETVKKGADDKYKEALNVAKVHLEPTHPTRLGLVLNASVFLYEIMAQPDKAQELAKDGFDKAIQKLDSLSDSTYKDSTLIMQLLRDNLTIWSSNKEENQTAED